MPKFLKFIFVLLLVVIIAGGVYYFVAHKPSQPKPVTKVPVTSTTQSIPPPTFTSVAPASFPSQYAPTGNATSVQYYDDAHAVGGIFILQESVAKAVADYTASFSTNGWEAITSNVQDTNAYLYFGNPKTTQQFQVTINAFPNNKGVSIDVEVRKNGK